MKRILSILLSALLLAGCSPAPEPEATTVPSPPESTAPAVTEPVPVPQPSQPAPPDEIDQLLYDMTMEERVGQLFLARCDDAVALEHIRSYHLGGFVLFDRDFEQQTPESMTEKLSSYQSAADIPLLIAVDEEGGTVTRVSSRRAFRDSAFSSPRAAYSQGGMEAVLNQEAEKCALLQSLGINVNLGPVCDITTDPDAFMYRRSLGQDAETTAVFVSQTVEVMNDHRLGSALKHFPGYGNNADTHTGIALDSRTLEALQEKDLIPFRAGITAGCGAVMVSHTIVEALDPELPASLSPAAYDYLRQELGFGGVILTDDLSMQAITDRYGAGEAAVLALQAGCDLLCSTDYMTQYEAVLDAVTMGRIDFDRLNNAVRKVLEWKMALGLLP